MSIRGHVQTSRNNLFLFILLGLSLLVGLCAMGSSQNATGSAAAGSPTPSSVRILSPRQGEKIPQTAITVRFDFEPRQDAVAPPKPIYKVRLDDRDPIQTELAETTFNGLKPGSHTVSVELVDANGIAIEGSRSQVQFFVLPQTSQLGSRRSRQMVQSADLGQSGDSVPLLSWIGLGALPGGLFSARRTNRQAR